MKKISLKKLSFKVWLEISLCCIIWLSSQLKCTLKMKKIRFTFFFQIKKPPTSQSSRGAEKSSPNQNKQITNTLLVFFI